MAEEQELTLVEIRERMAEVEAADAKPLKDAIVGYLASPLTQAGLIGRAYSVSDPAEREKFADWMIDLMDQVYRYATVTGHPAAEEGA